MLKSDMSRQNNLSKNSMKKILCVLALLGCVGVSSYAAKTTTTYEYYGEKARDSWKNPCKGHNNNALCGKKTVIVETYDAVSSKVSESVVDNAGITLGVESYIMMGDVMTVTTELISYKDENAEVVSSQVGDENDREYEGPSELVP